MSDDYNVNKNMINRLQLTVNEQKYMENLNNFYNSAHANKLLNIINGNNEISIRLIDYFLTQYSKTRKCIVDGKNIHTDYKQQLKNYQKTNFDPFSRGYRIPFFIMNDVIITTIGQLIFFKWYITNKIDEYILLNKNVIQNEMNNIQKIEKTKKIKINNKKVQANKKIPQFNKLINNEKINKMISVSFN